MDNQIIQFIDKYKIRYYRLMDSINSNNKLIFIHKVTGLFDESRDVIDFKNTILSINKNTNFCLVILINIPDNYVFIYKDRFLKINISKLINTNIDPTWYSSELNWVEIFNIIKNNVPVN